MGTGDPNISGYMFVGDGIYKSTDGGTTWSNIGLNDQGIISKIIIHPTNPDIIYVGTMGLPFLRNNDRGLYKTTDRGLTWSQVLFISDDSTNYLCSRMEPYQKQPGIPCGRSGSENI